jgi:hypothetical protein
VTKTYTLATLEAICAKRSDGTPSTIEESLPWHTLKSDGLWLRQSPDLLGPEERETMSWHPRQDRAVPALPFPFTARSLAAFMLAGGGLFLYERFADDEQALSEICRSARSAGAVVQEALRLRAEADAEFGRSDEGVRRAADCLLNELNLAESAKPSLARRNAKRMTWQDAVGPYIAAKQAENKFPYAKDLYRALESEAGNSGSPFDKGVGARRGMLVVRETGKQLELKTIQNAWREIRTQASAESLP